MEIKPAIRNGAGVKLMEVAVIDASDTKTLANAIDATQTSFDYTSAEGTEPLAANGKVVINDEIIGYDNIFVNSQANLLTRGIENSTAAAHAGGTPVSQVLLQKKTYDLITQIKPLERRCIIKYRLFNGYKPDGTFADPAQGSEGWSRWSGGNLIDGTSSETQPPADKPPPQVNDPLPPEAENPYNPANDKRSRKFTDDYII